MCYDLEDYRSGRSTGEVPNRIAEYLTTSGVQPSAITVAGNLDDGIARLAAALEPGDAALVLGISDVLASKVEQVLRKRFINFTSAS